MTRPICGNCGYSLVGLTESSKCPECGRSLVEVLRRRGAPFPSYGKRYHSKATLFGLPVIDVAGSDQRAMSREERHGGSSRSGTSQPGDWRLAEWRAGWSRSVGWRSGLLRSAEWPSGLRLRREAWPSVGSRRGAGRSGILASGGGAAGLFAQGGGALGVHTRGGRTPRVLPGPDPFAPLAWFFGHWPPDAYAMFGPLAVSFGLTLAVGALIGLIAWITVLQQPETSWPRDPD